MSGFIDLCTSFIAGCAKFFEITIPGIGITFFQLFAAFFILKAVIIAVKIIFGIDHEKDET